MESSDLPKVGDTRFVVIIKKSKPVVLLDKITEVWPSGALALSHKTASNTDHANDGVFVQRKGAVTFANEMIDRMIELAKKSARIRIKKLEKARKLLKKDLHDLPEDAE